MDASRLTLRPFVKFTIWLGDLAHLVLGTLWPEGEHRLAHEVGGQRRAGEKESIIQAKGPLVQRLEMRKIGGSVASLGPLTVEVTPEVGQRDGQGPGRPYCLPRPCLETVEPEEWWDQVCDFLSRGAGMGAGCQLGGCCRVQVAVGGWGRWQS